MICMEIKETIEAQRGDTHFNVENPSWVKNHGGTEAKSTMRNVYMSRSYNMAFGFEISPCKNARDKKLHY